MSCSKSHSRLYEEAPGRKEYRFWAGCVRKGKERVGFPLKRYLKESFKISRALIFS